MGIREPVVKPLIEAQRKPIVADRTKQPPRIAKPKNPPTMVLRPIPKK